MVTSRNVGRALEEDLSESELHIVKKASMPPEERNLNGNSEPPTIELGSMDQKKAPPRVRIQRTFRLYPELLEALSTASAKRKQAGYEQWSQDAIINHALKIWLEENVD